MTAPDVVAELAERRPALVLSSLLLVAGVLAGLSPIVGIVRTDDGSPTSSAVLAAFVVALPGLLAVLLALRRPAWGLAATAGGGIVGLARLLADLAVLTEIDRISRPELFAETTDRARPFGPAAGGWVLLLADLLMLVVGVLAATRLAPLVSSPSDPRPDDLFGAPGQNRDDPDGPDAVDGPGDQAVAALSRPHSGRRLMNMPMVLVGFAGAVLLLVGNLGTPYSGGYLALRILPFGSSLTGLLAAALLAFVAAIAVVVAAALPRSIGQALLTGTALAAAVPSLTAVVAVLTGAPTSLSPVVWWGLAGSLLLAGSALLARRGPSKEPSSETDGEPPRGWLTIGTGALALIAAGCLAAASQLPLLYLDGAAPGDVAGTALAPAGPPLLIAAIPLGVAGVLALIRATAGAGRAAVAVVWAGACYAFGQAIWARSLVLATSGGSDSTFQHSWTTGPGEWLTWLGTMLALFAATLAVVTSWRDAQSSPDIADERSLADSRATRRWPAVVATGLISVALALPVRGDLGTGSAPSLLHGYDLDTWGFWALAVGAVGAVWAGALTRRAGVDAATLVSAASLVAQPLFVPAAIRAVPGFTVAPGFWVGLCVVAVLIAAAPLFAVIAGRVRMLDPPTFDIGVRAPAPDRDTVESKGS
jgi:hypothetical protein